MEVAVYLFQCLRARIVESDMVRISAAHETRRVLFRSHVQVALQVGDMCWEETAENEIY